MTDSRHDADALLRSMGRIPVIRALLPRRTWPHLSNLSLRSSETVHSMRWLCVSTDPSNSIIRSSST